MKCDVADKKGLELGGPMVNSNKESKLFRVDIFHLPSAGWLGLLALMSGCLNMETHHYLPKSELFGECHCGVIVLRLDEGMTGV